MNIKDRANIVNTTLVVAILTLSFLCLLGDYQNIENFELIFTQIRLPRYLSAIAVATILSLAGLALQALFKNELAEPSILGISSGGTLGAVIGIYTFTLWGIQLPYFAASVFSVTASFLSILLVMKIAGKNPQSATIILIGVAINSFNGSAITLLSYLSPNNSLRNIVFWGMGSFASTNISIASTLMLAAIVVTCIFYQKNHLLNLLSLSEENLYYAGYNIKKIQALVIVTVTISVGLSVAFCGLISFVGLIAPHIARLLVGYNHKKLVITTPLTGICMILITDFICKNILAPIELPTSVITSFIGVPFFLHLLVQHNKKRQWF